MKFLVLKKFLKVSLLAAFLLFFSLVIKADSEHEHARLLLEAGDILSLQIILEKAQKLYPGRILEVELGSEGKQLVYEIELLTTQGYVLELLFDAQTGEHLSTEKDD
ncbi:MAG: PepSY domain-containing protein [Pseudomonadota bacterium]